MKYSKLGSSGLSVSRVCLGTMTWGQQNTQAEAHQQLDYALSRGINFIDTAEIYSIPVRAETYGITEQYIGAWLKDRSDRDKIILATKIGGPSFPWIRGGNKMDGANVRQAIEASLKRLQTDYVDVYQLHWPSRPFPHFGKNNAGEIDFTKSDTQKEVDNFLDVLRALDEIVKAGKVRFVGLSDDTAWGIMKYLDLAKTHNLPRMTSIQNEYSLLKRSDDPYLVEVCVREDVAYLPWSPLATGALSGKYRSGEYPQGSRWQVEKALGLNSGHWRDGLPLRQAVDAYAAVADKHGLDLAQMSLKHVDLQSFVTSTIIGATSINQLKSNIDAFEIILSSDVMAEIDSVYRQFPIPY